MQRGGFGLADGSELGRSCPACGLPGDSCACRTPDWRAPGSSIARVTTLRDGSGHLVTRLAGLPLDTRGLRRLAVRLRERCGLAGSVRDGVIELDGDRQDRVRAELIFEGFTVAPGRA